MAVSEPRLSDDQLQQLCELLRAYQGQLQRVEVLLEAQLLFANSGRDDQLGVVADLIDEAALAIAHLDLSREVLMGPNASTADTAGESLRLMEISDATTEPWAALLDDHRWQLTATVQRIQTLVAQSRHTMGTTLELITNMASGVLETPVLGYDRAGRTVRGSNVAIVFEGQV